jgi:hypothetical protein
MGFAERENGMSPKIRFIASALALSGALVAHAHATVIYTVLNPAAHFTLFVYDSPTFITTDATVGVAKLAFANPLNTITSVDFIPSSLNPTTMMSASELDVFQSGSPAEEIRYFPLGTFTQVGATAGEMGSFGFPNSELSVAVPEPGTLGLLGVGALAFLGLRRRASGTNLFQA